MDWKQWYGPIEHRRFGDTWAIPYEVWSKWEIGQHDQHVRLYYYLNLVAKAGWDIDDEITFDEAELKKLERPWR